MKNKREKKLISLAKSCMYNTALFVSSIIFALYDFILWMGGSNSGLWLAISLVLCACGDFYFLKNNWKEFRAVCAEIND